MLCQVGAVISAREASERVGSSGSGRRKEQQDSSERGPAHFSVSLFSFANRRPDDRQSLWASAFEIYDISNNNITNPAFLGTVGLNWQVMGFGNFSSRGETDMILRGSARTNPRAGFASGKVPELLCEAALKKLHEHLYSD
jgi:hypothetical protein